MRELYLNAGTHSRCPTEILEAVTRYQREYERNPTMGLVRAWPRLWKVQTRLAAFFGADPRDMALRINVTHAMNDFLLGARLPAGSEILLSDLEYPAVANIARLRAERDGLGLRTFAVPLAGDAAALRDAVVAALSPKTSLLVLSHVATGTGLILPLAEIARETRRRGVLLAVDGAHAAGALPLDFAALDDVDFYGGNLHKWMLGPKGTGFAWTHKRAQPLQDPIQGGWTTFGEPESHREFGGGSAFARRQALSGCHDFAPFFAIDDMLNLWDKRGPAVLRARLLALQNAVEDAMSPLGWPLLSPARGPLRGPLLAYEAPAALMRGRTGGAVLRDLWEAHRLQTNVITVKGRWAVRLSPHVDNDEDEIREAAERLVAAAA